MITGECTLTTFDNPFDPYEQFDDWFMFDEQKGYHTCSLLGRIVKLSEDMTEKEEMEANERAVDEIIKYDPLNIYKKVYKKVNDNNDTD